MYAVASLGSINVDRMRHVDESKLSDIAEDREWFPEPGETIRREECPTELIVDPDETHLGGKGSNQAAAAAHADADTGMFGKVGPDAEKFDILSKLESEGVDVDPVGRADVGTGTAYVFIDESGESWIVVCAKANGEVGEAYVSVHESELLDTDVVLLQNEIPIDTMETFLSRIEGRDDRPTVIFDPAPADGAERLLEYDAVDYITPNELEYEAIEDHLDAFDGTVIETRGGDDLLVEGNHSFRLTPPEVEVADSTGAGDTFNGFLAARLADGDDFREAVETAIVAGALSTRETGAQEALPTMAEVRSFQEEWTPEIAQQ